MKSRTVTVVLQTLEGLVGELQWRYSCTVVNPWARFRVFGTPCPTCFSPSFPMDTGSSELMRNIDRLAHLVEERLSLEGTVVVQRARELQTEARKLARQRAFLRDERRRARMDEELLRMETADFNEMRKDDWIPAECLLPPNENRVKLNVGGQLFEASQTILQRDPACLLAALCHDAGPLQSEHSGTVNVDRDWWTFRYIIKFLRDGILPVDAAVLTQLYREAGYWRLDSLKRAIEEQMHLYRSRLGVGAVGGAQPRAKEEHEQVPPAKQADESKEDANEGDWWTGSKYNGRDFSTENEGALNPTTENMLPATTTTWATGK